MERDETGRKVPDTREGAGQPAAQLAARRW